MKALQTLTPDDGLDTTDPVYREIMAIWSVAESSDANRPLIESGTPAA